MEFPKITAYCRFSYTRTRGLVNQFVGKAFLATIFDMKTQQNTQESKDHGQTELDNKLVKKSVLNVGTFTQRYSLVHSLEEDQKDSISKLDDLQNFLISLNGQSQRRESVTILNPVDEPNDAQTQKKLFIIIFSTENQTKKN